MADLRIAGEGSGIKEQKTLRKAASRSRPGLVHFVDDEIRACSCEAYSYGGNCSHIWTYCPDCRGYGTVDSYPHLVECGSCCGKGVVAS